MNASPCCSSSASIGIPHEAWAATNALRASRSAMSCATTSDITSDIDEFREHVDEFRELGPGELSYASTLAEL